MKRKEAKSAGLKKYNTGKPCSKGHFSDRYTTTGQCVECLRSWPIENKGARKAIESRYLGTAKGMASARKKYKRYYESNKDKKAEVQKEADRKRKLKYKKRNPIKNTEYSNRRRAQKLNATPPWYEKELILMVYEKAREYGFHVDHIVPLLSAKVCGLHCWHNLQIISPIDNYKKGNFTWPDMP